MLSAFMLLFDLAVAAPFVTTWRTTTADETIELPRLISQSNLTIDWGDLAPAEPFTGEGVVSHIYASPNTYNVSIEGQFYWEPSFLRLSTTSIQQLIDIVSWGDGITGRLYMFDGFPNLQVSAPPNTQPMFPPGADISRFFSNTAFNSSLDWDLQNVFDITQMFCNTSLNQPITFRNTQGVGYIDGLFAGATQFNQPFHFDASGVYTALGMFKSASSFNSILNLSNITRTLYFDSMFQDAVSFNQPITFNTSLVTRMDRMFQGASSYNQPVNFDTSLVDSMTYMFSGAVSFNQPVNFDTGRVDSMTNMFSGAVNFNQPVVLNTSNVLSMNGMFFNAASFASTISFTSTANVGDMANMFDGASLFTQDLWDWNTGGVGRCESFCRNCGLPIFPSCDPCDGAGRITTQQGTQACNFTTTAPSSAPTVAPSAAPSVAPSSGASSMAPSLASSSSAAPSAAPPAGVSPAAAAVPSLACGLLVVLALGFRL